MIHDANTTMQLMLLIGVVVAPTLQWVRYRQLKARMGTGPRVVLEFVGYAIAALLCWGVYELLMPPGMNIRFDLVLFFPFLVAAIINSVLLPVLLYRKRKKRQT